MDNSKGHRHQTAGVAGSPRLLRSKSGTPNMSVSDNPTCTTSSFRTSVDRSKSTTRLRNKNDDENRNPTIIVSNLNNKSQENRDQLVRVSLRSPRSSNGAKVVEMTNTKQRTSTSVSPSAWALSPGRRPSPAPESPAVSRVKLKSSSTMSGVLKYFRQKKVSPTQEEAFHRLRVLHNRLVQWRFVNARAETSMTTRKKLAEAKLFSVWLRIFHLQNSVLENRIKMQKLKQEIKLFRIISSQLDPLNEWSKIEKQNSEAIGRLVRKLSAISIRIPLIRGAKADTVPIYDAICAATGAMESMEATIATSFQIEKNCSLLKEIKETIQQQRESLEELSEMVSLVVSLEAQENSLRVYLIQAAKESIL